MWGCSCRAGLVPSPALRVTMATIMLTLLGPTPNVLARWIGSSTCSKPAQRDSPEGDRGGAAASVRCDQRQWTLHNGHSTMDTPQWTLHNKTLHNGHSTMDTPQ